MRPRPRRPSGLEPEARLTSASSASPRSPSRRPRAWRRSHAGRPRRASIANVRTRSVSPSSRRSGAVYERIVDRSWVASVAENPFILESGPHDASQARRDVSGCGAAHRGGVANRAPAVARGDAHNRFRRRPPVLRRRPVAPRVTWPVPGRYRVSTGLQPAKSCNTLANCISPDQMPRPRDKDARS